VTLVGLALLFGAGIWSLRSGCTDSRARARATRAATVLGEVIAGAGSVGQTDLRFSAVTNLLSHGKFRVAQVKQDAHRIIGSGRAGCLLKAF
jgi:hypothetical protein